MNQQLRSFAALAKRAARSAGFVAGISVLAVPLGSPLLAQSGDGFLFGAPHVKLSVRGGFALPSAGSEIFGFTSNFLTVGRRDFAGFSGAADVGVRISQRFEAQFSGAVMRRTIGSEFRDWVGTDDKPIEQTTAFNRVPLTAGIKYYITSPGRKLGSLAYIPARLTPYIGGGGGMMYYRFHQNGEFVDFQNLDVFHESLDSNDWVPTGYANLGLDVSLNPRFGLVTEARYDFASAQMSRDFQAFDRIDLSGATATVGLNIRF